MRESSVYDDTIINETRRQLHKLHPKVKSFSSREIECLLLLRAGYRNRDIGRILGINQKTVSPYINRLRIKVGLSGDANIYQLVTQALPLNARQVHMEVAPDEFTNYYDLTILIDSKTRVKVIDNMVDDWRDSVDIDTEAIEHIKLDIG